MRARVGAAHAGRVLGSRLCDRRLHRAGRRRPGLLCGVARLLRRRRRRGPRALGGLAHCWFGFLGGVFHRRDRLVGDVLEHRRRLVGKLAQRRAHAVGERLNGVGRLVNGDLRVCQRILRPRVLRRVLDGLARLAHAVSHRIRGARCRLLEFVRNAHDATPVSSVCRRRLQPIPVGGVYAQRATPRSARPPRPHGFQAHKPFQRR